MGEACVVRDRDELDRFLRRDAGTHVYPLADLDDFFWHDTRWYGLRSSGGELTALALVLDKLRMPVLYAVCPERDPATRALLDALRPELPPLFFANLGLRVEDTLAADYECEPAGRHLKMLLHRPELLPAAATPRVEPLAADQQEEVQEFYTRHAYAPGEESERFFEPYMLERWPAFGVRQEGKLVCAGGTHVLCEERGVAALGNVATAPGQRRRGFGRAVGAALAGALRERVPWVGLNVHEENAAAIRCYEGIGFEAVCSYREDTFRRRGGH